MPFKQNYSPRLGKYYTKGDGSDRLADEIKVKQIHEEEKGIFGKDTQTRRDFNSSIAEKVAQSWPDDQIIIAIRNEFPEEPEGRIKKIIEHWKDKLSKIKDEIEQGLSRVKTNEISLEDLERTIKQKYKNNSILNKFIVNYFARKREELTSEEER